jgi:hypothetical protein
VAGTHVNSLKLDIDMRLGEDEVEVLANLLGGSLTSLHLGGATLLDSFWRPLAKRFPHLRKLYLGSTTKATAVNLRMYLTTVSHNSPQGLEVKVGSLVLDEADFLHLEACVDTWGLENIQLTMEGLEEEDEGEEVGEEEEEEEGDQG